ncbi:MAG: hypothetical protein LBT59_16980 [Clostridiales bacterium]|nr:hypothetical protein [Clostridiales bacterium]
MFEMKLENYVVQARKTFESKDHDSAIKQLDKMIQSLSPKSKDARALKALVAVTAIKADFLEKLGRSQESEELLSKASSLEKSITATDAMEKAYLAISAAELHAAAGNFAKAASCVFYIDTAALRQDVEGAKLMLRFAKHSFQNPRAASGKAKRALVAAKEIFAKDKYKKSINWFLQTCDMLGKVERYKNQRNAALHCDEAWNAATEAGLNRCDTETLFSLCVTGMACDRENASQWLQRALTPSCKMLDKGIESFDAAKMFLEGHLAWHKEKEAFNPSSNSKRVLKCVKIIESNPESTQEELLLAQWLAGVRIADNTFSFSRREKPLKALELLTNVLEPLKSAGPAYNMHYGMALFGLADTLVYLGDRENAYPKYKEGFRVLQRVYGKDSKKLKNYKSQMSSMGL